MALQHILQHRVLRLCVTPKSVPLPELVFLEILSFINGIWSFREWSENNSSEFSLQIPTPSYFPLQITILAGSLFNVGYCPLPFKGQEICNVTSLLTFNSVVLEDLWRFMVNGEKGKFYLYFNRSFYNAFLPGWWSRTVSHSLSDWLIVQLQYTCFLFWVAVGGYWKQNVMFAGRMFSAVV